MLGLRGFAKKFHSESRCGSIFDLRLNNWFGFWLQLFLFLLYLRFFLRDRFSSGCFRFGFFLTESLVVHLDFPVALIQFLQQSVG